MTAEPAGEDARPRRLPGVSARTRIMLWLVVVMAVALGSVALAVRAILIADVEREGNQLLEQEAREFERFAREGRDPATGRPFRDAGGLLFTHLRRQHADDDELLLGVEPGGRIIRQDREGPYNLPDDAAAMRRVLDAPGPSGRTHSPAGEIRWAKVAAVTPDGGAATFVIAYFIERDLAEVDRTMRVMGAVSGVALLCGAGIGWIVSGRILAPVRLVRRTAAEITERDLAWRIPVRRRDDVGELAATFNAMLDRLDRAFATQRRFVDDAGHELRTPITIVRGHLELMGDDPAEREETMRLVTDELDRMSRIVEDLLLLAKAEQPDFVQLQWVPVMELTSDVYAKVRALGDRDWVLDGIGEGEARIDPQRLTQAVVQLAHNAVQHTVPGGTIKVGSALDDERVRFWVADQGPGVHPDDMERIFERFAHGSAAPAGGRSHRGGAGLGLAIVAAIAGGHGGTVRVGGEPGRGAVFELDLPRAGRGGGEG
ncbi:HAMP domain-containing sensor histidine kinase [Actinomadura viridis]|uniref:histidine kinase n=1 Tax=Actinomadura viridis TaxID=58110 RepID=A0A931GGN6_9ACTN|nr:ATP-binding protein [Actinomadura viridis]MBG6086523.1 signal transduction histidine kinase [Actinomadura viridis]